MKRFDDHEALRARVRRGLQASRYRKVVAALPPEFSLAELRRGCRISQSALARQLGMEQTRLSRVERQPNPRVELLRSYLAALGGTLHLTVRFPHRDVRLILGSQVPRP